MTDYGELIFRAMKGQIALSDMYRENITHRLLPRPKETVGSEGKGLIDEWRATKTLNDIHIPDVVIDPQGKTAIQIPGVIEHSEQIA